MNGTAVQTHMSGIEVDSESLKLQFAQPHSLATKPVTMLYLVCLAVEVVPVEKCLQYGQFGEHTYSTSYWSTVYKIKHNKGKQNENFMFYAQSTSTVISG